MRLFSYIYLIFTFNEERVIIRNNNSSSRGEEKRRKENKKRLSQKDWLDNNLSYAYAYQK
jgi:hypothetical protein